MKKKYEVLAYKTIEVEIDESKFTESFLEEYDQNFYDLNKSLDKHMESIAKMTFHGNVSEFDENNFIEGYGKQKDMESKWLSYKNNKNQYLIKRLLIAISLKAGRKKYER